MHLRIAFVGSVAFSVSLSVALFGGCGDDTGETGGSGGGGDLADVIYEAEATDEALEALLADTPKDEPARAAVFVAPGDGDALAMSPPYTFQWMNGQASGRIELIDPRLAPARVGHWLEPFFDVREAHAHGTPVNGPGYFLVLSTEEDPKLVRVFTLATEYTPDEATWQKITSAAGPISATILNAEFEDNRILQDGGPWQSEPITFSVAVE